MIQHEFAFESLKFQVGDADIPSSDNLPWLSDAPHQAIVNLPDRGSSTSFNSLVLPACINCCLVYLGRDVSRTQSEEFDFRGLEVQLLHKFQKSHLGNVVGRVSSHRLLWI